MKKYNLSEIMKTAWAKVKAFGISLSEALKSAWETAKNNLAAKVKRFKDLQRQIEELQTEQNEVKAGIIEDMNGLEEIEADIFKVRYITVISNRLDTAKFKAENKELYEMYLKPSEAKRFTVTA